MLLPLFWKSSGLSSRAIRYVRNLSCWSESFMNKYGITGSWASDGSLWRMNINSSTLKGCSSFDITKRIARNWFLFDYYGLCYQDWMSSTRRRYNRFQQPAGSTLDARSGLAALPDSLRTGYSSPRNVNSLENVKNLKFEFSPEWSS